MKMMIDRLPHGRMLLLLAILLVGSGNPARSQVKASGVVSGRIVEKGSGVPVEYANVLLIDTVTMKMLTGSVTDSAGRFTISDVRNGVFYLEYTFIGYQKTRTGPVIISRKNQKQELGLLELSPATVNMEEVSITAERATMITRIDRKVFNVEKDILSQSGTVTDMLQNIPSVSVDIDGNISLRGSGVSILINGRPSVLAGSANLEQMPASLVERIEVITNPSAKYRPDGTGGIINIILKKEQKAGLNGTLGVNGGANSRFNTNLQLNYNTGKFNLFGSYGYRQDYRYSTRTLNSQTIDTATGQSTYLEQSSEGFAWPASHLATAGFDWFLTKKDATGLSANFNYRNVSRHDSAWNRYLDSTKTVTGEFNRIHGGGEKETSLGLTGYYEHVFSRDDEHSLRVDIEYQRDRENEDDHYEDHYLTPEYPPLKDHTIAVNTSQETDLNLEYSRPLWEDASLEAGYAGYVQVEDINQDVEAWDDSLGTWLADSAARNRFHGVQWVHALYATLSWEWNNFSVMAGLRAEEALLNLDFISIDTMARNDYFDLYPTLHLGYRFGKNEIQLNYSKRVNRPDVDDMNPVPEYRDPRNIFVGNPDLRPEEIHSFELGYSCQVKALTLVPTLFYRYKVNGFSMVTRSINDSTLVTTIENLDTDQSAGLDFSGSWQIGKIAAINFSASGFYNQIDASSMGYEGIRSALSGTFKVNTSVNVTKTTIFQLNGQYRSKALTAQGYRLPTWVVNLGFRQDLWKKKLSVIATVSDLFNSQAFKSTVDTPILVQESLRKRDYRVIYAGLLFNFGTNGKKAKEPKFEFDNQMEGR